MTSNRILSTILLLNLACDPIGDGVTSATEGDGYSSSSSTGQPDPIACDPEAELPECPADRPRCVSSEQNGTQYATCASTCNEDRTCSGEGEVCVDLGSEQPQVCLPNCTVDSICAPGQTCVRPTLIDLDIAQVCFPNPTP